MAAYENHGESDEWYTPRYIFDAIGERFDLDVACPSGGPRHVPAAAFLTVVENGLIHPWNGFVWMNPPFGHQSTKRRWLSKFFAHGNGIALVPDRTSAPWFQEFAPLADAICWVSPKIKFERPDGTRGESPGTGTALFAAGERAALALDRCGLGMVTGRRKENAA
ncbi:DNA N-6-adenine-methyltransferase [Falsirhodobacter sp. 1013]|uniref:DNA N-6-adenine-methyltransferase n=1 Tax=Falsirhodobacter sp. 1013 TaxID=3417566 RepID=UPI003EBC554D